TIKPRSLSEKPSPKLKHQQHETHDSQGDRKASGESTLAKDCVGAAYKPKMHRRPDQIADAIHVHDDVVVALEHFVRHQRMSRIHIAIHQSGAGGGAYIKTGG